MITIVILAILTLIVSCIGTYALSMPGFDLTLIGVIIAANSGENILLASILLTLAYMLPKPTRLVYFIQYALFAWLAGYIAAAFNMTSLPIFLFHALLAGWDLFVRGFTGGYLMNALINIGWSLFLVREYTLMS